MDRVSESNRRTSRGSHGAHDVLKLCAAGCWRHGGDHRFAGMTAEGGNETRDEGVEIAWLDIHVRRIALRTYRDVQCRPRRRPLQQCSRLRNPPSD